MSQRKEIEGFESKLKIAKEASNELETRKEQLLNEIEIELKYLGRAHDFREYLMDYKCGEAVIANMKSVESEELAKIYDKVYMASNVDLVSYMTNYFLFQQRKFIRDYTGSEYRLEAIDGSWLLQFDSYIAVAI